MITLDSIDYANHSIQIKDSSGDALAISAGGAALIEAVDLDIRDLAFATDKVDVSGSSVGISSLPATFAEDSVHASGDLGMQILAVRRDTPSSFVSADGDYSPLMVNASGSLRVVNPFNNTIGAAIGTNAAVIGGTDAGTIRALKVDATGQLFVVASDLDIRDLSHAQDSVKVGDGTDFLAINADGSINVQTVEAGYSQWKVTKETVTATAAQLVAAPLSNRLRVEVQNLGANDIFVKENSTAVIDGLKIPKGSSWEITLDAGASIHAIAGSGSSDVRVAEYAA